MSTPFLIGRIERLEARVSDLEALNVPEPATVPDKPVGGQDGGETPKPKRKTTGK